MRNKWIYLLLALNIIVISFQGCTTFGGNPKGVWICEELGITINFDDNSVKYAAHTGKGTIIIDGEEKEIVCGMDVTGDANFLYIEDVDKHPSERTFLYEGLFKYISKEKNKMTFQPFGSKEKYTFVKQD